MSIWRDKERKDWVYSFRLAGERHTKRGHKTRAAALDAQEAKKRSLKFGRKQTPNGMALSLAASHYLDFAERRFARKTYQYKKMILQKLVGHLGDREMEEIRPVQVQEFLLTRPSNHNFNVTRKEISTFWNYITKTMNLPVHNPCHNIDRMPEKEFIKYIPPQDDVLKLLMAAGEHRPMLQVIIGTLGRIDEVLRMRWQDVDFKTRSVRLWTRKNKDGSWRHRDIPMNESLLEILKGLYEKREQEEWVFYNRKTGSRYNRRPKIMPTVCRRAKIKPFGFHSLRHFSASTLAHDPKVAKKTISGLLGHLSLATTEIYLHSIEGSQRDAVKALDEVMVATFGCESDLKGAILAEVAENKGLK
jgi:integrase